MRKLFFGLCILALAILAIPQTSHAILWSGVTTGYAGSPSWTATVNWEVWAPGENDGRLALDTDYHYYYYVSNTTAPGGTTLSFFSVGNPANVQVNSVGWVNNPIGTVSPFSWSPLPVGSSVWWTFTGIPGGAITEWLYFTSPIPPTWVPGGVQNGGTNDYHNVPGPAPEPTTMTLLGLGLLGLGSGMLRKRFKA